MGDPGRTDLFLTALREEQKQRDSFALLRDNWVLIAAVLAAAMFVGKLEQRVTQLEHAQEYLHGSVQVPGGK